MGLALCSSALAAIIDVRKGVIPNWITYSTLAIALLLSFADADRALSSTLLGFALGFFFPLILFVSGHLGGGDLKLFAALGAALGFPAVILLLVWAFLFGFVVAILYVIFSGRAKQLVLDMYEMILVSVLNRMGRTPAPLQGQSIPLGLGIFFATAIIVLFPDRADIFSLRRYP